MFKIKISDGGFGLLETLITLFVVLALGVVGLFVYEHYHKNISQYSSSTGTNLIIIRDNSLNQPGVSNFTKTVSHSFAITILSDINSLKPVPGGPNAVFNCPNDDGVDYTFKFTDPTLNATAPASGCQFITVNNKQSFASTTKFWSDVSKATGHPVDPDKNFQ